MNSKVKGSKSDKERNVQVFVRVRPMNDTEKKSHSVVTCNGTREIVVKEKPVDKVTKTFTFDKVFGPDSKQIDVYKSIVHPLIEEVLAGYNCTVFAYGQTGTGKTFTMEGEKSDINSISWEDDPLSGIIPRSLSHLFDELRLLQAEYTVRVSFLELYNEEIFDLLSPADDATKLRLFEDNTRKGSVIIQGLEEVTVHNKQDVYKIMSKGSLKRTTAATLMNAQSSRSHTVFSITVHIKENSVDGEELLKTGKLNLVDLAGSENIGRSGAIDKRAREAGNINQSLLTLGRCITSLVEHCPHIPYRESKLTRLLQESLGGRTKTSIIATVSPAMLNLEETLSTLDYAHRAKNITNRPEINQKLTKKALLKEYTEEIERLRRDLEAAREKNGVYIAHENYTQMIVQLEQQEEEIMNKLSSIKVLKEEMDKKEELFNSLQMNLDKAKNILQKTVIEKEEKNYLIEKHIETEKRLRQQALELTATVNESTKDTEKLHKKLDCKKKIEEANIKATQQFKNNFQNESLTLDSTINDFRELINFFQTQQSNFEKHQKEHGDRMQTVLSMLDNINSAARNLTELFMEFQKENNTLVFKLDGQRNITDEFKKIMNSLFLKSETSITDILNMLNTHYQTMLEDSNKIEDSLKKNRTALDTSLANFETLKIHVTTIQENLKYKTNILHEKCKTIQALEIRNDEIQKQKREELKAYIQKYLDNDESTSMQIKNERNVLIGDVKNISNLQNEIEMINEYGNYHSVYSANLRKCTSDLHLPLKMIEDNVETIQRCLTINTDTEELIKNDIRDTTMTMNTFIETTDHFFHDYRNNLKNQLCNFEKTENDVRENFICKIDDTKEYSSAVIRCHGDFQDTMCEEICEQRKKNETLIDNMRTSVMKQQALVDNLVMKDFQHDITTGQTPERRTYQYPKELATMSPQERLLHRFRKEKPMYVQIADNFENYYEIITETNNNKINSEEKFDNSLSGDSRESSRRNSRGSESDHVSN